MKKITAILFLSIYLLQTTGLHELLKINTLVQHFHETQKNDSAVTFYHFLVMHYVTDDLNDMDNERDKQLPFKSADTFISNAPGFYIPDFSEQPFIDKPAITDEPLNFIAKDLLIDTDFNCIVWHPPKSA